MNYPALRNHYGGTASLRGAECAHYLEITSALFCEPQEFYEAACESRIKPGLKCGVGSGTRGDPARALEFRFKNSKGVEIATPFQRLHGFVGRQLGPNAEEVEHLLFLRRRGARFSGREDGYRTYKQKKSGDKQNAGEFPCACGHGRSIAARCCLGRTAPVLPVQTLEQSLCVFAAIA